MRSVSEFPSCVSKPQCYQTGVHCRKVHGVHWNSRHDFDLVSITPAKTGRRRKHKQRVNSRLACISRKSVVVTYLSVDTFLVESEATSFSYHLPDVYQSDWRVQNYLQGTFLIVMCSLPRFLHWWCRLYLWRWWVWRANNIQETHCSSERWELFLGNSRRTPHSTFSELSGDRIWSSRNGEARHFFTLVLSCYTTVRRGVTNRNTWFERVHMHTCAEY